jgi:hypothetical protein
VTTLVLQSPGHTLDGKVVCFTAATGEYDLITLSTEQLSDLAARAF